MSAGRRFESLLSVSFLVIVLAGPSPGGTVEYPLVLDCNFNGIVHATEAGQPDAPNGFRSISDRALRHLGAPGTFADLTSPNSGLSYDVVDAVGALDILHVGNRNTVDGGTWAFDPVPDGDFIGIQPDWLPSPDQTTVTTALATPIALDGTSEVGLLYNISNGGGFFAMTLHFDDGTSITVTLHGPDWYAPLGGTPNPPGSGVSLQQNLANFTGTQLVDRADNGPDLIVTEAVASAPEILADLSFDVSGRVLSSITFGNRSNPNGGYAVFAITVTGTAVPVELQSLAVE